MRNTLKVLGRIIGTFDGWDGDGVECMVFCAFKPCDVLAEELPEGDLTVNFHEGTFTYYEDDGAVYKTFDMLPILNMVQRSLQPTPTVADLEKILQEDDKPVTINPDGSITVQKDA